MTYRSKYEQRVHANAKADGIVAVYEPTKIGYPHPVYRGSCSKCGQGQSVVYRPSTYIPDFGLKNGTYVETKGKFTPANRTRMLALKAARPDLTVRILFQRDNWLTKSHKHKYSDWCRDHGFEYAIGERIPKWWSA